MDLDFSVVIPLYNREDYIGRAIGSVLSQTHQRFEILVVNDGSSDRSVDIVSGMGDSRVRLINQPNQGPSTARNTGIRHARYNWIAFLDSDDEWLPTHLAEAARTLRQYEDLRWYFSGYSVRTQDGHTLEDHTVPEQSGRLEDFFAAVLRFHFTLPTVGIVHKSVFEDVGDFSPELVRGEDLELWFRIGRRFPAVGYSPELTAVYYQMEDSLTATNKGKRAPDWLKMLKVMATDVHRNPGISDSAARFFESWAMKTAKLAEFEVNYDVIREILDLDFQFSVRTRLIILFYLKSTPVPALCRYLLGVWRKACNLKDR